MKGFFISISNHFTNSLEILQTLDQGLSGIFFYQSTTQLTATFRLNSKMHLSFHWMRNRITTKLHSFPKTVKFYLNTLLLHNNCSHRITKFMAFIIKDKCPCSRTTHSLFSHSPTLALYQFNFVVTVALFFSHRANERCGKNHGNCKFLLLP